MVYFTADNHFGHTNIMKYCNRPFSTVEEMDETLIANWNGRVKPTDTIYVLGDFCWHNPSRYTKRLNGEIHLIAGNHDHEAINRKDLFKSIKFIDKIRVEGQFIVLCHYSMRTWDASHYGSYMLYGHTHAALPPWGKSLDVGVDEFNYCPVSFNEIKTIMDNRPDTPKPFEDVGPFREYFWYKVQSRKPTEGFELLLWDGKNRMRGTYIDGVFVVMYGREDVENITHWMYLPEPPNNN